MLNATELCNILKQEYDISTDRRTIYTEIEILEKFGLDVVQKKGKNPGCYIGSRELIKKLEKMCCKTDADMLSRYVFIVNRPKTENETVYYNVDYIHSAIYENKEITFQYEEWSVKMNSQA